MGGGLLGALRAVRIPCLLDPSGWFGAGDVSHVAANVCVAVHAVV